MLYLLVLFCAASFSARAAQMSQTEAMQIDQQAIPAIEIARRSRSPQSPELIAGTKKINSSLNKAMCAAAKNNDVATLRRMFLEDEIPDINSFCKMQTPLAIAAANDNYDLAIFLVGQSADPNKAYKDYTTPFENAVINNNIQMMKLLVSQGAQPTQEALDRSLIFAAREGTIEMMQLLLQLGANINTQPATYVSWGSNYIIHIEAPNTPLVAALRASGYRNRASVIHFLISHGADVNVKNTKEQAALHVAAYIYDFVTIKDLVDHGAEINAKDTEGATPLMRAAWSPRDPFNWIMKEQPSPMQSLETIKVLVALGADPSITNEKDKNKTVLDYVQGQDMKQATMQAIREGLELRKYRQQETEKQLKETGYYSDIAGMIGEYAGTRAPKRPRVMPQEEEKENAEAESSKRQRI